METRKRDRALSSHSSLFWACRHWSVALLLLGLLLLTQVYGQDAVNATTQTVPAYGGVYREGVVGTPLYVNPLLSDFNEIDRTLVGLLFRGLMRLDARGALVPDLAESYTVSEDGLVYTFTLRPDVRWHDGLLVTSEDALYTFEVLRNPDFPGDPAMAAAARLATVRAVDALTLELRLEQPFVPFLDLLTVGLVPQHIFGPWPVADFLEAVRYLPIVGNGPMQVARFDETRMQLTPNRFHGGDVPYIGSLEFRFHPSAAELFSAFVSGELEGLGTSVTQNLEVLPNKDELRVFASSQPGLVMVLLNLESDAVPQLRELQVRQALLHAVNRGRVLEASDFRWGVEAHTPVPSSHWSHKTDTVQYAYDPLQAVRLLDAAGWRDRDGDGILDREGQRFELSLLVDDDPALSSYADVIAQYWRDVGIVVETTSLPFGQLLDEHLAPRRFQAVLMQISGLEGEPDPFRFWHSSQTEPGQLNYGGWSNPYADELMAKIRTVLDPDARLGLYHRFQDVFAADLPALPISHPVYVYGVHERVKQVQMGQINRPAERFQTFADWYILTANVAAASSPAPFPN